MSHYFSLHQRPLVHFLFAPTSPCSFRGWQCSREKRVPGLETWQKILLKCGANTGSRYWRNLAEKVNAKKTELTYIIQHHMPVIALDYSE